MPLVHFPDSPTIRCARCRLNGIQFGCRTIIFTLSILILSVCRSQMSWAQSNAVFLSPGIKLSHAFGEDGGFVFGIELSCYREIGPPGKDLDFAGF
jgi:hypothetical protein